MDNNMNLSKGFIYLRDNIWWRNEKVIKMGITTFAKDRDNTYITSEIERGQYIRLIEIPLDKMKILDKCLKLFFKPYNIYKGGGTEFYDRTIIELIVPYLNDSNIDFTVLTDDEINSINRCERIRNLPNADKVIRLLNSIKVQKIIQQYKNKKVKIIPKQHQEDVLNSIEAFYQSNHIGKLIWACGLGKALLGILIVKILKCKIVAIGVPGNYLQRQIMNEILKIFPNKKNILFVGGDCNEYINATKDKIKLIDFMKAKDLHSSDPKFVITTYHSCHLLTGLNITFDLKIGDEAHHLVGLDKDDERKGFRLFHKIKSHKTLFMTATEKTIESQCNDVYSMDDESIFGKYIDVKSVHWAIESKMITDYNILVLKNTENEVTNIISNLKLEITNNELFISCYMTLKSIDKYEGLSHILLYTTTIDEANQASAYIDAILSADVISIAKEMIYYNSIHSKSEEDFDGEVYKFKNAQYGIITCVNCFGEGVDIPKLNGVCVASNMQSEIRIVQYLLRPNRLESGNPNKRAYIIIPYIEDNVNKWDNEKKSFANIRTIISQLRNVDLNIEQKISVQTANKQFTKCDKDLPIGDRELFYQDYYFEESAEELNKLKIRLRYSKTLSSDFTEEQDEYNYIRTINKSLNIQSKEEYVKSERTHPNYIEGAEEYFKNKGVWDNWYDFMGTDTSKFIQSKQDWVEFCKNKNIKTLCEYNRYCDIYDMLPKNPGDFYRDFTNIYNEVGVITRRR
jgi:superfamily II DNA or RNA helicase